MFVEKRAQFQAEGEAVEGETRSYRFVVAQDNVTRIDFLLGWRETGDAAGISAPDVFTLSAKDGAGRDAGAPRQGDAGELHLAATGINPLPETQSVPAESLDAFLAEAAATEGKGEWRAWIKLDSTGNPRGTRVDNGNAFSLTVLITYYEAVPLRVVSLPSQAASAAVAPPSVPWALALGGLALLAGGLGVLLALDARRRKARALSTGRGNTTFSER